MIKKGNMLRVCIKRYQIQKQGYLFHSVDKSKDLKHASTAQWINSGARR